MARATAVADTAGGQPPVKAPTAIGTGGAAATVDVLATDAAIDMLRKGGNAVDATVAAAGVLGVTEPFSAGIGGGGFMVIRTRHGKVTTIDGRETAPAAMSRDSFFENGAPLPFADARYSGLSAGVPGTVATWEDALDRYGTKSLRKTLEAGIDVARRGLPGRPDVLRPDGAERATSSTTSRRPPRSTSTPTAPRRTSGRRCATGHGQAYELHRPDGAGRLLPRPDRRRDGDAASRIRRSPRPRTTSGARGLLTEDDIARYDAIERAPTRVNYRGLDVWGMGPPSSGGSTVGEALNILEGYAPLGADRTQALHRFLEASRLRSPIGALPRRPGLRRGAPAVPALDSFAAERRALITDTAGTSPVGAR